MRRRVELPQRFTDEDVGEIIRLAARLDNAVMGLPEPGLTLDDVTRIAGEMGIPPSAVAQAVSAHLAESRRERRRFRLRAFWRRMLQVHLFLYGSTVTGLAAMDYLTGGGFEFVQYVASGWGVLLAWQAGLVWLFGRSPRITGS
jgi:hypothetical protein